jgi:hypothetical protein
VLLFGGVTENSGLHLLDVGALADGDLVLTVSRLVPPEPSRDWVAAYEFEMRKGGSKNLVGMVKFRAQ